jgi:hypothetical protein
MSSYTHHPANIKPSVPFISFTDGRLYRADPRGGFRRCRPIDLMLALPARRIVEIYIDGKERW